MAVLILTVFAEIVTKTVVEEAQLKVDVFLPHSRYQHPVIIKFSCYSLHSFLKIRVSVF